MQHIAGEVGLDPKIVAAAAAELEHGGIEEKASGFLGAPTSLYVERVIPGEIDEALYPEVAAKIGEAFGLVGRSGQVGRSLEWTHSSERTNFQVTVAPHNGQTKVRVIGKYPRIALAYFVPALLVGGMWSWMFPLGMGASPAIVFSHRRLRLDARLPVFSLRLQRVREEKGTRGGETAASTGRDDRGETGKGY